ncbi:SDR family NAD(P)-dependent oxidoreductase [Paracoccus benzoatiresistens]|uniref:SDR family NAD(P)-dependent oxidoreductase n=1 Tax=Paracoccus benzoatiresistens TaxID=2997341 RepID=A0ABT4J891_9RHOB|nr:SDR family NAD(P)-dependent oxidoreductase [Paracoccus sp. EF6]MCZ0963349.1 SDR family NAD(P)-dependent oxidoreductase [Paracoccus sp. EF6]
MADVFGFQRRRALVTGASSGIGHAVAAALARHGAAVAIHFNRGADAARALADRINRSGGMAVALQADLSDDTAAPALVRDAAKALGGIDILVNNAGAMGDRRRFAEKGGDVATHVFDLNCRSLVRVTHAALPWLQDSSAGAVVNTGSIAGRNGGGPGAGFYAAAKGYVHTLTRGMAREFAPLGIRVNAVAPGVIATPFHDTTPPDVLAALRTSIPMGRLGTAQDCVGPFLFLCSENLSGYVTGQIVDVNGGQYMP